MVLLVVVMVSSRTGSGRDRLQAGERLRVHRRQVAVFRVAVVRFVSTIILATPGALLVLLSRWLMGSANHFLREGELPGSINSKPESEGGSKLRPCLCNTHPRDAYLSMCSAGPGSSHERSRV